MADVTNIAGRINSISQEGVAVLAAQTLDERKNKKQSVVNQETDEELANHGQRIGTLEQEVGSGGSVDERIAQAKSEAESDIKGGASEDYDTLKKAEDAIKAEVNAREGAVSDEASARQDAINAAKTEIIGGASTDCNTLGKAEIKISTNAQDIAQLQAAYEALTQSTPVIVEPTDIWPVATPEEDVIYRVIDRVNTPPQKYSDYMYNGTAMVLMATYDNAIDDIPTPGSNNLVKSGGVASHIVYDISEANAIGSTLATYADLAAALGNNGANIPPSIQKGGMSVKFIQSSDNTYVQFRLMKNQWSTTPSDWQGVDTEIVAGSGNLAESGSVAKTLEYKEVHAKEISPSMEEIYTSTTDNHLDVQNVVKGVYIKQQSGAAASFTASDKGIVSRFIYVEGVSKVTVSCSVVNNKLSLMFLSKPILDNQYRVNDFSFIGSSRTVSVPSGSKYLVVCLREPNTNPDYDYSGIKLSLTDSVAVQDYSGKYLGRAGYEYLFGEKIATADEIPIATVENTRSDVDVMQGATVKDASLTYNTTFVPDTDAAKVLINIEAGQKYKVCVRDNDNVITKVYAIYKIINGSRSSAILTQFLPNTISQEFTAENGFDGLAFYIDRGDILKSGTVELVLYDISDSLEGKVKRLDEVTAEMEDKIFDKKASKTSVSTGFEIPLAYAATAGNDIAYRVTSKDIDAYYFYVKYAGSDSFTNLGLSTDLNKIVHRSVSDNITDIKIFISAEHVLDRETYGTTTLEDCRALEGQVIDNTESIEHLESELGVFKQVANNALVRFIPFTSTVPTVEGTYQTPENFIETFNLLFFTDSHIDYANQAANIKNVKDTIAFANSSKRLMAFGSSNINKQLFDAVIHTGDIITSPSGRSKESALAFAKSFFDITEGSEVPVLFAPGNHDRNDRGNPPSAAFTFADWATLYGDFAEANYGIVRGTKDGNPAPWFYKDFDDKKVRVISVFVNDVDMSAVDGNGYVLYNESNGFYISQDQMDFIVDEALDFTQKPTQDWNVIITLHQSVWLNGGNKWYGCNVTPAFESALAKLFEVCKAFNAQGTYTNTYTFATNHFFDLDIDADFTGYATAKWDSYTWQQSVGADKGVRYVCGRSKDEDFAVNFVDSGNTVNYYYLYIRYVGDASETLIGKYAPNEVRNITLTNNIEAVYILVKNEDITGAVNATVEILQRKPRIICWLNGHEHIDAHKIITGTNAQGVAQEGAIADGGINIIWTAQGAAMMFASNMKVPRIIDSPTQNLLDLVSIDTIRRKIRIIRVGAGPNCFGVGIPYDDRFMPDGLDY